MIFYFGFIISTTKCYHMICSSVLFLSYHPQKLSYMICSFVMPQLGFLSYITKSYHMIFSTLVMSRLGFYHTKHKQLSYDNFTSEQWYLVFLTYDMFCLRSCPPSINNVFIVHCGNRFVPYLRMPYLQPEPLPFLMIAKRSIFKVRSPVVCTWAQSINIARVIKRDCKDKAKSIKANNKGAAWHSTIPTIYFSLSSQAFIHGREFLGQ